jgi:AraC-like DNA-binding protein
MIRAHQYRSITAGVETLERHANRPRHRHWEGYATVVLAGNVTEASFSGRAHAIPGDVLLHGRFDCHMNIDNGKGRIQILRLPWHDDAVEGQYRVHDPDLLVRIAERDPLEATRHLALNLQPLASPIRHWTEELARLLMQNSPLSLRDWAECKAVRPDVVSHAFRRDFGVSPKLFRLESRARRAWRQVINTDHALTRIALDAGFADLAHMSNAIRAFTGWSPSRWRSARPQAPAVATQP